MSAQIYEAPRPISSAQRIHMTFLDGLRGLAALYVVLYHSLLSLHGTPHGRFLGLVMDVFDFGHQAVDIFIVLSGYCLMLPIVNSVDTRLRGGMIAYIKRRARRILPPYYAALAFSILCLVLGNYLQARHSVRGNEIHEALTAPIIMSHLFLIHNLDFTWAHRINTPMWTVATEWQIYFLFPLLLLPVWRRFGNVALVLSAVLIGSLPVLLLPPDSSFYWAYPWFLGLFAMGMAGAALSMPGVLANRRFLSPASINGAGAALFVAFLMITRLMSSNLFTEWLTDMVVGMLTVCVILHCVQNESRSSAVPVSPLFRLLQSPAVVLLGTFSYSLYLVHNPIQAGLLRIGQSHTHSTKVLAIWIFTASFVLILPFAYLFHCVAERPFMSAFRAKGGKGSTAP